MNHLRTSSRRRASDLTDAVSSGGGGGPFEQPATQPTPAADAALMQQILGALESLDVEIEARLQLYGANVNAHWGYMSRAGFSDKSHLMRQVYAL